MSLRILDGRPQFSLRSLLFGLLWLALLLGVCAQYQRAAGRQREAVRELRGALGPYGN